MKFIGIDIGTTTICAVCINDEGQVLHSNSLPNNSPLGGQRYEALQSPQLILDTCRQLIKEMLEQSNKVAAIGISNQMHGILYIDEKGEALSPLYTWQDGRGNLYLSPELTYCERLMQITGYPMATGYGLSTHFYNSLNASVPAGAVKLCTIGDYVAMQLCGRSIPLMHPSNGASLGLFDLQNGQFDAEALKKSGINPDILPEITKSEVIMGKTQEGIPVCAAIGDNQASVFGSLSNGGSIHVNIGTSSQISIATDHIAGSDMLECRPYLFNKYLLVGTPLCGGYSYQMLKRFFEEASHMMGIGPVENLYDIMNKAGLEAYAKGGGWMTVDTRFCGTRRSPHLHGNIMGISPDNFKPQNLIVALLKGICEELYTYFQSIPHCEAKEGPIYASGNGIRLNPLLLKLLEDTFSRKVVLSNNQEEASFGAAKAAMLTINSTR